MNDVRVGSEVVCADSRDTEGLLFGGRVYVVSRVSGDLIELEGVEDGLFWTRDRFVLVQRDVVEPEVVPATDAPTGAPFATGDMVRVIVPPLFAVGHLEKGEEHVVDRVEWCAAQSSWFVFLVGVPHKWAEKRFELIPEPTVEEHAPLDVFDAAVAEMRSVLEEWTYGAKVAPEVFTPAAG